MHNPFGGSNSGSCPGRFTSTCLQNTTISHQADIQEEQNKILMKQLENMIEKEVTSKNCFKNLHDSTIQMIIFASALDGNEVPTNWLSPASASLTARRWPLPNKSSTTISRLMV